MHQAGRINELFAVEGEEVWLNFRDPTSCGVYDLEAHQVYQRRVTFQVPSNLKPAYLIFDDLTPSLQWCRPET